MTHHADEHSLSRLELVVLARLSSMKSPTERALGEAVLELVLPGEAPARAREVALETLAALRGRGLVNERGKAMTDEGRRALRAAFGATRVPTWSEVRDAHIPALALGLPPGSEQASKALRGKSALTAAVLREHLEVREAPTPNAVCDVLLAEALGLPPGTAITLNRIRAHVLARRADVEAKGSPAELAARIAAAAVRARRADRRSMLQALARRWVSAAPDAAAARPAQPGPAIRLVPSTPPPVTPAPAPTTEALLEFVRKAIPRIGPDGRYGAEKVFVSAIWRNLERDQRVADLSLDFFKRWLVTANRDGRLVLARADLIGAMDARLVAESEIQDQGATFHFVLDRPNGAPAGDHGSHAR